MSGDDQDNQIPKTLKATNWSRIHEIAKNNEFLRKPAQGRPNQDEDDNPTAQIPQNEALKEQSYEGCLFLNPRQP